MAALKTKKNIQWEKAQQRINVSPLVSRISGFSKVGAPRKGWSSGSGFWGECLPEETADACPGALKAVGCVTAG